MDPAAGAEEEALEADQEPGPVGVSAVRGWNPLQPRRPPLLRFARNHINSLLWRIIRSKNVCINGKIH